METKRPRITVAAAGVFILALGFFPPRAFPFEHATHAHIAEHVGNAEVRENSDTIYAAMAPGFANLVFDFPEHQACLSDQTDMQFMKVWAGAPRAGPGVWLAYGFLSHNDVWGADSVAHLHGMTFERDEGQVTAKASLLADILEDYEPCAELGFPREVTEALCHKLVEDGLDILLKGLDPSIGRKITSAAFFRTSDFPVLLVKAYARCLAEARGVSIHEASKFIFEIEATIDFVRENLEANGITWYPRTAAEAGRPWPPARERRKEGNMI